MTTPPFYQIKVKGQLDPRWSEWFDGLTISHEADGSTILFGAVVDQAALYRILLKLHDLNLPLLAVNRVETEAKPASQ
jgi:hypothetical protein